MFDNSKFNIDTENLKNSRLEYHLNNDWIENPSFDGLGEPWESRISGDSRDVTGNIALGQANYLIQGDSGVMEIDEPLNNVDWQDYNNPDFPISPDTNGSSSAGLYISHEWDENEDQTRNTPSIHWKRTITMPVNMSDYIITEASLDVIFNATVTAVGSNPLQPHIGGIERPGDYTEGLNPPTDTQLAIGDFATFYVLISDLENNNIFQIAINKTTDLGKDSPETSTYSDTALDEVPEALLKSYLNSVMEYDNFNFTITLGIDVYCEDNEYNADIDTWNMLIMRSFNLTFTYEKKIDQLTSISWEQVGNAVTGNNVQITKANLNFTYKIDRAWPEISSPNSEIRVLLNDNPMSETIKLNTANASFQNAKEGGYDVTSLILKDVNVTLSIQVYLADEFGLDQNITVSIDEVYLTISYVEIFPDIFSEPWVFAALLVFASIVVAGISGYLVAYQRVLKYPRPVRKVMKYRRSLNRSNPPDVAIMPQDVAFKKAYDRELTESSKLLKIKPSEVLVAETTAAGIIVKESEKVIDSEELISKSLQKKEELDKLVEKQP